MAICMLLVLIDRSEGVGEDCIPSSEDVVELPYVFLRKVGVCSREERFGVELLPAGRIENVSTFHSYHTMRVSNT